MFWIALAAQLAAPAPLNYPWIGPEDVPQYLGLRGEGVWFIPTRLVVAPTGQLERCEVELSSGITELDRHTCALLLRRAKFQAARWTDGSAVYGVYRTVIAYGTSNFPPLPTQDWADLRFVVNQLPKGLKSRAVVRVMFAVDFDGQASACVGEPPSPAILVELACQEVVKDYKAIPLKDSAGKLVPSVQNAIVEFSKGKP
jgi:hypothetical protein